MTVISQNYEITENYLPETANSSVDTDNPSIYNMGDDPTLGKSAFLKLLITQLQNQDPLNPMEGVEFTSQLAQFSQLEQLFSLNNSFVGMNAALQAQNNFRAMDIVGKEIKAAGTTLSVTEGVSTGGYYKIEEPAASVVVSIYDENGSLVRTLDLGAKAAGEYEIDWDGRNGSGQTVPDGQYTFDIVASDADKQPISVESAMWGKVTGVRFDEEGTPTLMMKDIEVALTDIIEIVSPAAESEETSV
jgi:flagellar basal-body rod modification protein FlgD